MSAPTCSQAGRGPGERVLDHPLAERLGDDRPAVLEAEPARDLLAVAGRGGGHDAVDHRAREARVALEPLQRAGAAVHARAEVVHEPAQHDAVARQVVAGDERQRARLLALRAQRDAAGELPDRGARRPAREVGRDLEVVEPQPAGGAVARVGLLGHGQRDHVDARVGDRLAQAVGLARGEQHVADRRDDRDRVLLRPALEDAEQPVLRAERVDRRRPPLRDAEDAPVAARALDRLGGVDGLVGAVERADAEVDDADGGPLGKPGRALPPSRRRADGSSLGSPCTPQASPVPPIFKTLAQLRMFTFTATRSPRATASGARRRRPAPAARCGRRPRSQGGRRGHRSPASR